MRKQQQCELTPWVSNHYIAEDGEVSADSLSVAITYYHGTGDYNSSNKHQLLLSSALIANGIISIMVKQSTKNKNKRKKK